MRLDETVPASKPEMPTPDNLPDGWTLLADGLEGPPVLWPTLGTLGDRLFSFGGDGWTATVRSSADGGRTWTTLDGDCPVRMYAAGAVLDDQLWIAGGQDADDTWASADGRSWRKATAAAGWGQRWLHALIPFEGRLHLLGGSQQDKGVRGDVWVLEEGGWSLVNDEAFPPRYSSAGGAVAGQMVLMGGHDATHQEPGGPQGGLAEALVSADGGMTWTSRKVPWGARWGAAAASLGDALYLVGGIDPNGAPCRDVWSTRDAVSWTKVGDDAPWEDLLEFGLAALGDYLVLAGGVRGDKRNRQVWAFKPPA